MKKQVLQKKKAILLMSLHFGFIYLLMNPVNLGSVEENLFMTIFVLIEVYVVTVFYTSLPPFSAWMDTEILLKVVFLLFYPVGSLLVFERLIDRRKSTRHETYQQAEND